MAKAARPGKTGRFAAVAAGGVALLAAVAGVIDNGDKIFGFLGKRLGPWLEPKAVIEIAYRADPSETIAVGLAPPSETDHVSAAARIAGGTQHRFVVIANGVYSVVWQGSETRGTSTEGIVAVPPEVKLELGPVDEGGNKRALRLVQVADRAPVKAEPTVSAALLVSAGATASAGIDNPAPPTSSMLPEFDRAATIIGLFQTGSTDCSRRVFLSKFDISVGCFAASLNARFDGGTIISEVDGSDQALDRVVGKDDADALRAVSTRDFSNRMTDEELDEYQKAIERVTGTLEFWSAYDRTFLRTYARASTAAREMGLESERGVLLVFSEIAFSGRIRQPVKDSFARKLADQTAAGLAIDEGARVSALAEALAENAHRVVRDQKWYKASLDLMRTGKVSWQGIDYDLDQLGIGLTPVANNQNVTIKRFGSQTAPASSPTPTPVASAESSSGAAALACGDIDAAIAKLVVEKLGVDAGKVTRDANLIEDLGADDLDIAEITIEVESRYGVELGDLETATVGDLDDALLKWMSCPP